MAYDEFNPYQINEITLGIKSKVDVSIYAKPEYDWFQMEEIRVGLENGLDVNKYTDSKIPFLSMRQIRIGLMEGIDLSGFARLSPGILREVRKSLEEKVNITQYISNGYSQGQLRAIRHALAEGVNVEEFIDIHLSEQTITEMAEASKLGINIAPYMDEETEWRQLREIRLGLEKRLPVSYYCSSLFSYDQMREIRLGFEEGLNAQVYADLILTVDEMRAKRTLLSARNKLKEGKSGYFVFDEYTIVVEESRMNAYIFCNGDRLTESFERILSTINQTGIVFGIIEENIKKFIETLSKEKVLIATGIKPQVGEDGYYEFMFETDVEYKPNILEDGSVDYQNIKWFEEVKEGDIVAKYHPATIGKEGKTVTDEIVSGKKGKELPVLKGTGFKSNPARNEYIAGVSGMITLKGMVINITPLMVVEDVSAITGAVVFDGIVRVRGNVGAGSIIRAGKGIYVEGNVEGANLESGGDVVISNGCNANGKGLIEAQGDVKANFFENANIKSGKNIVTNSIINSVIEAEDSVNVYGNKGFVFGGKIIAGFGIAVQNLGNEAGASTYVCLNGNSKRLNEISRLEKEKESRLRELKSLGEIKTKLLALIKKRGSGSDLADTYAKVDNSIGAKLQEIDSINNTVTRLKDRKSIAGSNQIEIKDTLYEGVTIVIGEKKCQSRNLRNCVYFDRGGKIAIDIANDSRRSREAIL